MFSFRDIERCSFWILLYIKLGFSFLVSHIVGMKSYESRRQCFKKVRKCEKHVTEVRSL